MEELIDESVVHEFVRKLPDLKVDTAHLIALALRGRKVKLLTGRKMKDLLLEREIIRMHEVHDWRPWYMDSVYNLAVLQNQGRYEVNGVRSPAWAMGIYATLSPRDVRAATRDLMVLNAQLSYQNDESSKRQMSKQFELFFARLHKQRAKGHLFNTLDLDSEDEKVLGRILDDVSSLPIWMVTETSRGFHVILELSRPEDALAFHAPQDGKVPLVKKVMDNYGKLGLELQRDSQEPIPGTSYFRDNGSPHRIRIIR